MERDEALEKTLYRHLGLFGMPSASQFDASRGRIRERLSAHVETSLARPATDVRPARAARHMWHLGLPMAAAFILLIALVSTSRRPGADSLGSVDAADGSLQLISDNALQMLRQGDSIDAGKVLRSNGGAGAVLALGDGSRIEMRAQSELSLERAEDGMRIRLHTGSIIVNAAKQPSGHLYVQTKDMTVSVVGTVFLVNAEDDGSRVAVIEGEVRVHEAKTETKLRPGEQVSSSSKLEARPVTEEIAWSRRAAAHLALLQREAPQNLPQGGDAPAAAAQAQPAAPRPQFEVASIRRCDPESLPPTPSGRGGASGNTFQSTPGRAHALCVTLATLIRTAYGSRTSDPDFLGGPGMSLNAVYRLGVEDGMRVRGGRDWVRTERYTIDAVADAAADAETMRGPMLRALLDQRFQLKAHIEAEQIPAFELTVARGGVKLRSVGSGACVPISEMPGRVPRGFADVRHGEKPTCGLFVFRNGPNTVTVGGELTLDSLARQLSTPLGGVFDAPLGGVRVIDKTGITDTFNFMLEYLLDGNGLAGAPQQVVEPSSVPRGQSIFTALEDQLGLKLEPVRAPREFIVIDRVERLSPN